MDVTGCSHSAWDITVLNYRIECQLNANDGIEVGVAENRGRKTTAKMEYLKSTPAPPHSWNWTHQLHCILHRTPLFVRIRETQCQIDKLFSLLSVRIHIPLRTSIGQGKKRFHSTAVAAATMQRWKNTFVCKYVRRRAAENIVDSRSCVAASMQCKHDERVWSEQHNYAKIDLHSRYLSAYFSY